MKIEEAGLINPGWRDRAPNKGVVATSVVAIVVRPGNPAGIEDWGCLTKCALKLACSCVTPSALRAVHVHHTFRRNLHAMLSVRIGLWGACGD